jgi:hypothetical protein
VSSAGQLDEGFAAVRRDHREQLRHLGAGGVQPPDRPWALGVGEVDVRPVRGQYERLPWPPRAASGGRRRLHLLLTRVDSVSGLPLLIIGVTVAFIGTSSQLVLGTDLVVGSAPPEKAGSASSMSEASSEFGVALGVATVGSIGTAVYRSQVESAIPNSLPTDAAEAVRDSVATAAEVAAELPDLLAGAREAFTHGLNVASWINAGIAATLAVLVLAVLRRRTAVDAEVPSDAPSPDRH